MLTLAAFWFSLNLIDFTLPFPDMSLPGSPIEGMIIPPCLVCQTSEPGENPLRVDGEGSERETEEVFVPETVEVEGVEAQPFAPGGH